MVFQNILPEATKKQEKLLIGDNLSSHFLYHVVKAYEENDTAFVPLPPNATHLMQSLDVCFLVQQRGIGDIFCQYGGRIRDETVLFQNSCFRIC